ncbi:MAG TPA: transcriptional repressor [Rhodocyclaceae bacterium]
MKASAPPLAEVQSAIRAAGARVTPARVRVLAALRAATAPQCHAEIEESLAQEAQPAIDRVTLYRVLDWLCSAGLAHKAADARGVFRFSAAQPNVEHAGHVHFRCTGCGGVFCLKAPPPPVPALPRGFRLGGMAVDIRGECPRCVRAHS